MASLNTLPQTTNMSGQTIPTTSTDQFSIPPVNSDSPGVTESRYTPEWERWNGIYTKIPEFNAVINKLASWTFGRGIVADEKNQAKLDKIKGFGKDTPRSVLKNQWRVALICGDSFAHIVKDPQGRCTNLKPLNSGSIVIVRNSEGIIVRYEQMNLQKKFDVEEIYHLQYEPVGDNGHGTPFGEKLEDLIMMRNEAMQDQRIVFHRYVKPIQVISVDTDTPAKLQLVQDAFDTAYKKTENIIIPKGIVEQIDRLAIPQFSTLDPLNWLKYLIRQFVTACGVPEIIMGWSENSTEASGKISYLAFQQEIEDMQLYNEEQCELQLNIEITLEFPADLMEAATAGVNTPGSWQDESMQKPAVTNPASSKKDGNKSAARPADVKA